jgi:hypothetical protein
MAGLARGIICSALARRCGALEVSAMGEAMGRPLDTLRFGEKTGRKNGRFEKILGNSFFRGGWGIADCGLTDGKGRLAVVGGRG